MANPRIEALLDALRTGFFAVIAFVLTIGVDAVAKALGFDTSNQLTVIIIGLITAVLKAYDKGVHVSNVNDKLDMSGTINPSKGIAPF